MSFFIPDGELSPQEEEALATSAALANQLSSVLSSQDYREAVLHIHAIQNAVLANLAIRTYPERYRS